MDIILTKEEVIKTLGKENNWYPKRLIAKTTYISGIPAFDKILDKPVLAKSLPLINIISRQHGLELELLKEFGYYSVVLPKTGVSQIFIENRQQILVQKEKSEIGKILLDGLIKDPAGALIADIVGINTKKTREKMPDVFIIIKYTPVDNPGTAILLSCLYQEKLSIMKFFKDVLPACCKYPAT